MGSVHGEVLAQGSVKLDRLEPDSAEAFKDDIIEKVGGDLDSSVTEAQQAAVSANQSKVLAEQEASTAQDAADSSINASTVAIQARTEAQQAATQTTADRTQTGLDVVASNASKDAAAASAVEAAKNGVSGKTAVPVTVPDAGVEIYNVSQAGTYVNFGNLSVNSSELSLGLVQLRKESGVWKKHSTPIDSTVAAKANTTASKLSNNEVLLGQLDNNIPAKVLPLPDFKRYTGVSSFDKPASILVSNVSPEIISATGYTDKTAMNPVYFDTGIPIEEFKSVFFDIKINAIGANEFDPSVGFGNFYSLPRAYCLRKDGFNQTIDGFGATLGTSNGSEYVFNAGDVLTFQLENQSGVLYYRVKKNNGVWTAWVDTVARTGNHLIAVRGSVSIEYSITIVQSSDTSAKKYTDEKMGDLKQVPLIIPSSTYQYNTIGNGTDPTIYRHYEAWYFGKSSKVFNKIGVFLFKNLSVQGVIAGSCRVQLLRKRASVDTVLLDYTIPNSVLKTINVASPITDYRKHEIKLNLPVPTSIQQGDLLYFNIEMLGGFSTINGSVNYLDSTGEWNNGVSCFRSANQTNTEVGTITTIPSLPAGVTTYAPFHFYYEESLDPMYRVTSLEGKVNAIGEYVNPLIKQIGALERPFTLNGIQSTVNTSSGYDFNGEPDTLMIICHGNGQNQNTVKPGVTFRNFMKANRISYATIQMQDQASKDPESGLFTTKASGWGNEICIQRVIDLYNYLMTHYNFNKSVILCARSMGGLTMGHLSYTQPFPIRFCLGIGIVPSLKTMFTNGGANRKEPIRNAYGMAADGSNDAAIDTFIQGYDWFSKGTVEVSGVKWKNFNHRLYMFSGKDTTFTNEFGNTAKHIELRDAINRAGGYCYYQEKDGFPHDDPSLFDDAVSWGVFLKEMGIPI